MRPLKVGPPTPTVVEMSWVLVARRRMSEVCRPFWSAFRSAAASAAAFGLFGRPFGRRRRRRRQRSVGLAVGPKPVGGQVIEAVAETSERPHFMLFWLWHFRTLDVRMLMLFVEIARTYLVLARDWTQLVKHVIKQYLSFVFQVRQAIEFKEPTLTTKLWMTVGHFSHTIFESNPARIYLQTQIRQWIFWQCLPLSWTTLRGKHYWHPIAIMSVVNKFEPCHITLSLVVGCHHWRLLCRQRGILTSPKTKVDASLKKTWKYFDIILSRQDNDSHFKCITYNWLN